MPKNKYITPFLVVLSVAALLSSGFALGFGVGRQYPKEITVQGVTNPDNPTANVDFSTFWQAWQIVNTDYLRSSSTNPKDEMYGSISGLVQSLHDPYSVFFPPVESKKFQEDIQGNFSGIGAEIGMRKDQLVIIAPLKNTPADRAGLKSGDQILKINSSSTQDMTIDEAVKLIRGDKGTTVTLNIFRSGWDKPKDFPIKRDNIQTPTLDFAMKNGNVAYIQLYQFNANASGLFKKAANQAISQGAKGVVLDLRNNPGGYLEVAVDLAGWFIPKGTMVVSEATKQGIGEEFRAQGNEALKNIPVVVLINGGSASASEILAGALRDDRGAKLVGEKSFGKGTVQQIRDLPDGSSIKLTIAHWVMPSGKILESEGISPDIEVKLTEADAASGKDPQLDKALETIKSEIK